MKYPYGSSTQKVSEISRLIFFYPWLNRISTFRHCNDKTWTCPDCKSSYRQVNWYFSILLMWITFGSFFSSRESISPHLMRSKLGTPVIRTIFAVVWNLFGCWLHKKWSISLSFFKACNTFVKEGLQGETKKPSDQKPDNWQIQILSTDHVCLIQGRSFVLNMWVT